MNKKLTVAGQIIIPIYLEVQDSCTNAALMFAKDTLNQEIISVVQGDIHTWDGKEMPLIARRCRVEWFGVVPEDEIV